MAAYTTIDDPSAHFQVETYTGNSTSPRSITLSGNSDMKPDWTWIKTRNGPYYHYSFDSSRYSGSSYYRLVPSENFTESVDSVSQLSTFNTDGFTLAGSGSMANVNWSTQNYVAWNWKANGGTTASNTDGDITSTVQANTDAGFSIVTYTGNGSQDQTIGHGLGAVPKMILFKNRSNAAYWYVYHIGTGNDTMTYLDLSNSAQSLSSQFSTPTTTTFNVSNENSTFTGYNTSGNTYVAYVFADVQGYSKFGSYVGNGSADGTFVYTGFKPAFLIMKKTDGTGAWHIFDNKRLGYNINNNVLQADVNDAELAGADYPFVDILSNGFKTRRPTYGPNVSGATYLYVAFAENPFVTSTGVPTTAR